MNRELISQAVGRRLAEVRSRVGRLEPDRFGAMNEFVSSVRISTANLQSSSTSVAAPNYWIEGNTDCFDSLRQICLGKPGSAQNASQPPAAQFLRQLKAAVAGREPLFRLLVHRYACALNFSLAAEDDPREFVLMRLMVSDRSRIESATVMSIDEDEVLLKLNLIAIHATVTTDLRFLDALNYYYELLPATWHPNSENNWLVASYLALYARALMSWS